MNTPNLMDKIRVVEEKEKEINKAYEIISWYYKGKEVNKYDVSY